MGGAFEAGLFSTTRIAVAVSTPVAAGERGLRQCTTNASNVSWVGTPRVIQTDAGLLELSAVRPITPSGVVLRILLVRPRAREDVVAGRLPPDMAAAAEEPDEDDR